MSGFSYGVLGLLLMLDIMFLTNYFVVRALRKWADVVVDLESTKLKDNKDGGKQVEYKASCLETLFFGWVLGKVKPDKLSIHRFPGWKPIPFFFGVTSTSILVLIALAMLTPTFLYNSFGLQLGGGSLNGNLCNAEDANSTLVELNNTLKSETNFDIALEQHRIATAMMPLLQADVTLYGTGSHKCDAVSDPKSLPEGNDQFGLDGTKEQWSDITVFPAAKWGTYFPGYCRARIDAEVQLAALRVCGPREICECPRVPDVFPVNVVKSWVGKRVCAMEVCFTFDNIPCGELSDDPVLFPESNYIALQQQHAAEMQQLEFEQQEYPHIATDADLGTGIAETFTKLMGQIDMGSNIYSVYACISLYFPAPLDAFRLPYSIAIKQFTFGAQKGVFMVMVIAIWWLYDKLSDLLYSPEIQLFFNNLRAGDPCFLDGAYIVSRQELLAYVCDTLVPLVPEFGIAVNTSTNILNEVDIFSETGECACSYPGVNLGEMGDEIRDKDFMSSLGFTRKFTGENSGNTAYLPALDVEFVANVAICEDYERAREIVLQAPETSFSGYELWIESGLFATIILKFTMANFVIALLKIADPFVVCAGRFVWIPAKFGLQMDGLNKDELFTQFKQTKESSLFYINLRGAIFWGVLMHWALWNLMSTAYTTSLSDGGVSSSDVSVLRLSMTVASIVVAGGLAIMCCLKASAKRARHKKSDGKLGDDSDEGSDDDSDDDFDDEGA